MSSEEGSENYDDNRSTGTSQDDSEDYELSSQADSDSGSEQDIIQNEAGESEESQVTAGSLEDRPPDPAPGTPRGIDAIFVQRSVPVLPVAREEIVPSEESIVHSQKKIKLDETHRDKKSVSIHDDSDEDQRCPICLENWSNAGEHRLCSLRCGHLFGLKCIEQWFNVAANAAARKCPECNTKASRKDIRIIYAKSYLKCLDTSEIEKLKVQIKDITAKKESVEFELKQYKSKEFLYEQQIKALNLKIAELQKTVKTSMQNSLNIQYSNNILQSKKIFNICDNESCRVMAYNPWHNTLVVSSGNAISKIIMDTLSLAASCNIHYDSIRDIAVQEQHPNYLLTVGLDSRVVLTDIRNNNSIHSYQETTKLWSCCWSNFNDKTFFVGGAKGTISEYDIRFLESSVAMKENSEDRSPIVSLVSVSKTDSALQAGGYIACHLNSCYAYSFKEGNYLGNRINLEGPFTSLRYNEKDNHLLVSCRPSSKNPVSRHIVCSIEKCDDQIRFNPVHIFRAGNLQKLLSRPCYINSKNDTMVVAYNESIKKIVAWSISSGKEVYCMPFSESVFDICCFENETMHQSVLTKNKLYLYDHNTV